MKQEEVYKDPFKPLELNSLDQSNFTSIECPKCSCNIPANNINIQDKIAVCDSCSVVFSFQNSILKLDNQITKIKKPSSVEVLNWNDGMEFCLTQPFPLHYVLILFLAPIVSFICAGIYFAESQSWALFPLMATLAYIVFIVHKAIGFKRNKTYINVDKQELTVERRPKNFKKDVHIPIANIDQLYVNMTTSGISLSAVINEVNGQAHKMLLGRFSSILEAKYIEQEIENRLGITNKKVSGEVD